MILSHNQALTNNVFETSGALCQHIAGRHNTVILSFSRGKDSIAAWLQLLRFGVKVIPVHLWFVPGISFVEESLKYYADHFRAKIYDLPHPSVCRWLRNFTFQSPENLHIIEQAKLRPVDYDELFAYVRRTEGLPADTPVAVGVTRNDSLNRRATIKTHGPFNRKRNQFYPIFDWNKARILAEVAPVGLPVDYQMFGRSWDGLDYRFLKPIHDTYPADYDRILEVFPMAEIELLRMEWRAAHGTQRSE